MRTTLQHFLQASLSQLVLVGVIGLAIGVTCSKASAATVLKSDDTTVTGDMLSIKEGSITIGSKPAPVVIRLDEILQITMKEMPAAPAPKPAAPAAVASDDSSGALGNLFGPRHGSGGKKAVQAQTTYQRADGSTYTQPTPAATAPSTAVAQAAPVVKPTSQPAVTPLVQMTLTDGDVLHARLLSWAEQKLSLKLTAGPSLEVPSSAITQIWFGTDDLRAKAKALTIEPGPEDVALVARENDVIAVKGLVLGIEADSLQFRYGEEDRKIVLTKLVGVLLRSNNPAPLSGFHQLVHIDSGDQFSGTLSGIDHDALLLATPAATMKIQISSIASIDFLNGRVSSLCDLAPSKVEETPYFGRMMPYQIDKSLTGGPLVTLDGPVARGIAVHSRCVLEYDLSAGFDRFKTRLGFQQPEGQPGRVLAKVLGDGKVLFQNLDVRGDQPGIDIDLPLTGVKTLTLLIDFGNDQDVGDRVVWASPRLIRIR